MSRPSDLWEHASAAEMKAMLETATDGLMELSEINHRLQLSIAKLNAEIVRLNDELGH